MKKILFVLFAIGILSSCGSAGRYCAEANQIQKTDHQEVVTVDHQTSTENS